MSIKLEKTSNLGRKLTITIEADQINELYKKELKTHAAKVQKPGFRRGKVPVSVVEAQDGQGIRFQVVSDLMYKAYTQAVNDQSLKPAGQAKFEPVSDLLTKDGPVEFIATFEEYPEVKPVNFSGVELEKIAVDISESEVQEALDRMRKQFTDWAAEEGRAAQEGDKLTIDFIGSIDGVPFEGGAANGVDLVLGSKSFIPGFEEQLIGIKAGEQRGIEVTFPDDYRATELAGKLAHFQVTVHGVQVPKLPELNDELAKRMNLKEGGLPELKEEVKTNLQREADKVIHKHLLDQILKKIVELNPLDIPAALIEAEAQQLRQDMFEQMKKYYPNVKLEQIPADSLNEKAQNNVHLRLIASEIISANNLKADPEKIRQRIDEIARMYEDGEAIRRYIYRNQEQLSRIENELLEAALVDHVVSQAQVKEVKKPLTELLQAAR